MILDGSMPGLFALVLKAFAIAVRGNLEAHGHEVESAEQGDAAGQAPTAAGGGGGDAEGGGFSFAFG